MLTVIEKVLLLQDFELFKYVYSEHLAQLASVSKVIEVGKDSVLFREGEPARMFHLLLSGTVALEVEGREVTAAERDGLDCWSFFAGSPYRFTARALNTCRLLTVSADDLVDLLTAEPDFCWALTRQLALRGRRETHPAGGGKEPSRT